MRGRFSLALITVTAFTSLVGLAAAMVAAGAPGAARTYLSQAAKTPDDATGRADVSPSKAATGTPAAILDDREVDSILGKTVKSSAGENMGRIVDVLVSRGGKVRGVVIDFGGFLGVGMRKIAIDWDALLFNLPDKSGQITVNLTRDQLRVAPEYKPGEPVVILGAVNPTAAPGNPPPAQAK